MSLQFTTLDVFTTTGYVGNPVAIIHVPQSTTLTQDQKQLIAREFNLSESVFLHEQTEADQDEGNVRIDIFTVHAEVPFAGHPTVGTSNYLLRYLESGAQWTNIKALQTKAGRIPITLSQGGSAIELQVAHNVHTHDKPFASQPFSQYPVVSIVKGMTFILANLESLEDLTKPTVNLLGTEKTYTSQGALGEGWKEGLIATYFYVDCGVKDGVRQLRSRMFGSREDPATGSGASALCSFLSLTEDGNNTREFAVTQGVEMGRKSEISIRVTLDEGGKAVNEVLLRGTAVKVMEGSLQIPSE